MEGKLVTPYCIRFCTSEEADYCQMLNMSLVNYCLVDSHLCEYGLLFLLCCNLCGHALCKSEAG